MMVFRRATAVAVALVVSATFAVAQQAPKKDEKKLSKQQEAEIKALLPILDGAMNGQAPPADAVMLLEPHYFKSVDQRIYVPFVLKMSGHPKTDTVFAIRVVSVATAPPAGTPAPDTKKPSKPTKVEYPWEDVQFIPASEVKADNALIYRAFMAPPGAYDVFVVVKERLPEKAPKSQVAKAVWMKTTLTLPDFSNGELNTSTVINPGQTNMLTAALSPEEMRTRPFVFGPQELLPTLNGEFKKTDEFAVIFQIYNAGLDPAGKPNVTVEYEFHKTVNGKEEYFNKTPPQEMNASTMPPQFDATKFLPGGIGIPLASFGDGQYRLAIKITDKAANKTVTRDVKFTVKG